MTSRWFALYAEGESTRYYRTLGRRAPAWRTSGSEPRHLPLRYTWERAERMAAWLGPIIELPITLVPIAEQHGQESQEEPSCTRR